MPRPPVRRALAVLASIVGALLFVAGSTWAQPKAIKAATLADWPPEYSTAEDGSPTGFAIDVMSEVARRASAPC